MSPLSYLQIRTPKDDETPIEAATQIFSSLLPSHVSLWKRMYVTPRTYSFEIYLLSQVIYFYITTPTDHESFIKSLTSSSYPLSKIQKTTDPMDILFKSKNIAVGEMILNSYFYLPIKTYADFNKIDPLATLIGFLSKQDPQVKMAIQIIVTPSSFPWQKHVLESAKTKTVDPVTGASKTVSNSDANKSLLVKKASYQGGRAAVRVLVSTNNMNLPLLPYLQNLSGTFGSFSSGEGNQFVFRKTYYGHDRMLKRVKERKMTFFERGNQILNAQELATLWHPAGLLLAGIKNIAWGKTLKGEPPENLPVATETLTDDEKKEINFFGKTDFKNKDMIFGIKSTDRSKHVYIMGKTGSGKSTLIANMAIDDIRKDRGIGIIDPHGDLCETVVNYIPKRRINDVIYLEPFDTSRPFSLNILETHNPEHKHLIASGIVSIFSKLYANSWGPRLEYILRNVILTLIDIPGATLADVLSLLAHEKYRKRAVEKIQDPVIKAFWEQEFEVMPPRMKSEAISPIQNKVGQFVTSPMIRPIIGRSTSTINLEDIMDNKKILLLNLSQGKLGEDNAALLGAMIITQIQLTAMSRAYKKEEDRTPFYMYVDEFQNFATSSFLKILSEARKYRLALTLANQYIDQLDLEIQRAIFGNVGTLMTFVTGARDAQALSKEFAGLYTDMDLVSLGKFEIIVKLSIDMMTSFPFPAKTLPLPSLKNANREKILRLSKEKYGRKINAPTVAKPESSTDTDEEPKPIVSNTAEPAKAPTPQPKAAVQKAPAEKPKQTMPQNKPPTTTPQQAPRPTVQNQKPTQSARPMNTNPSPSRQTNKPMAPRPKSPPVNNAPLPQQTKTPAPVTPKDSPKQPILMQKTIHLNSTPAKKPENTQKNQS